MTKQLLTFDPVQQRESHDSLHKFPVRMCVCEVCVCTYHHLQRLLCSHSGVVCGHLSQRLLQRLDQQHHRAHHGDNAEHQTAVEPATGQRKSKLKSNQS